MFAIVQDILDVRTMAQQVASEADGAIVTFSGIVRGTNKGKKVLFLEYEAKRSRRLGGSSRFASSTASAG